MTNVWGQAAVWLKSWAGILVVCIGTVISGVVATVLIYTDLKNDMEGVQAAIALLQNKATLDALQWVSIRSNNTRLIAVEHKTKPITEKSWEDWGRVKNTVLRLDRTVDKLVEKHSRSFAPPN